VVACDGRVNSTHSTQRLWPFVRRSGQCQRVCFPAVLQLGMLCVGDRVRVLDHDPVLLTRKINQWRRRDVD